jgi:uncharacterized protein (TIGR02302 family)
MTDDLSLPEEAERRLLWPVRLTHAGLVAERVTRSFWPLVSIMLAVLASLMLGLQDHAALELVWAGAVAAVLGSVTALVVGLRRFRWPTRGDALARLDASLPGRPITAIADTQAIGAGDAASEAVWRAHVARMAEKVKAAKPVEPDLRLADRDPYALRYVALVAFVMAVLFGSVWRVASVADMAPGGGQSLATGPAWEGWIEPPAYTGRPSLYLNDIDGRTIEVAQGSRVTIRLYGEIGALTLTETVSGRTGEIPPATEPSQTFDVTRGGTIVIDGPGGRSWDVAISPDAGPEVALEGPVERAATGEMRQPFRASDDYGVVAGKATIALDLPTVDRRHGLTIDPETTDPIVIDLPMTISGDRTEFVETLVDDLSQHPWSGLPVTLTLTVEDAIGQSGATPPEAMILPGRRFFEPLAAAVVEQRRDLLWNRANGPRVAQVLRTVSHRPDEIFRDEGAYLMLRAAIRQLEGALEDGQLDDETRAEIAQALWDVAVLIEEGDLADALERLRRAQDQLAEAIENGANDEEIARLMQELREAMQEYMRQLAQQGQQDGNEMAQNQQDMQEITGDQLEQMLQRLQELMEQGRMAEAQQLLDQLRQMMENMQVTQGQGQGQGQQGPGQQAMEGLAETLRQQQGLSDETFGDLQEQFNPGQQGQEGQQGQQGQQPGQQQGTGQGEGLGQGEGQGGEQFGQQEGQGTGPGQGGQDLQGSLADRQQALRDELERQQQGLPGAGTPEGDAARQALDRAGRAMDEAEESLRQEDFAGALDDQAEAMEALREGMRELGEMMAQQQQEGQQGGEAFGQANPLGQRDPLGRDPGQNGRIGTDQNMLQGEDVYRRAEELLDEIRRRSGEQQRPEEERDYLRRLLERF